MNEKELRQIWKKHIQRRLYRVTSEEYVKGIKKNGLDPRKDPFDNHRIDIKKLFALLLRLEKKGYVHTQQWGDTLVYPKKIARVTLKDLNGPYLDFTPSLKEVDYYLTHRGGCLPTCVFKISHDMLEKKLELSPNSLKLVKKLYSWSKIRLKNTNKVIYVNGDSPCFESAYFQRMGTGNIYSKYWKSPFGRFEHFSTVYKKHGIKKYLPYLTGEKSFTIRVREKILAGDITFC